jgi:hypothetical protein
MKDGIDRSFRDNRGWTPLRWAQAVVEILLEMDGIDQVNIFGDLDDPDALNPLLWAAMNGYGHKDIMEFVNLLYYVPGSVDSALYTSRRHPQPLMEGEQHLVLDIPPDQGQVYM